MIGAQIVCNNNACNFRSVFTRQYCLSRASLPTQEGWKYSDRLSEWGLAHCPLLESRVIKDATGEVVGWLLGSAVDSGGNLVGTHSFDLSVRLSDNYFWETVEKEVTTLAGRYLAIFVTNKGHRAYFDPVADLPAVYNPRSGLMGSSPLMALSRPIRVNHFIDYRKIIEDGGNYGLQHTCDPDVKRVLPNHYLDLQTFALHRHWPTDEDLFGKPPQPVKNVAEQIVERLGQITGALLENYTCKMPLTGGFDSRTLAFSAKSKMHFATQCFAHRTNWISRIDCYVGQNLASALNLDFQIYDAAEALKKPEFNQQYISNLRKIFYIRTGYLHSPSPAELMAVDLLPPSDLVLRGNILDMSKGHHWLTDVDFDIHHGISKLAIGGRPKEKNVPVWEAAYLNWKNTLPKTAMPRIYDFAFIELLLPNTLGARLLNNHNAAYINPFNDRALIKSCMQVKPKMRISGKLNKLLHAAAGVPNVPMTRKVMRNPTLKAAALQVI